MSLTPELIQWLQSEDAAIWLEPLTAKPPADAELLATLTRLRRKITPAQAAAVVETARLRQRAAIKFPGSAARIFASRTSLQQASASVVAAHTASRFARFRWVADLGCGLGGDSLALAKTGLQTLSVDNDSLHLALIAANARALHCADRISVLRADVRRPAWRVPAAWADPGRRVDGRRLFNPEQLQPPLSALLRQRWSHHGNLGVKLMPGLAHAAIPPNAEAEWISLNGELKEAVLWFGDLVREPVRRATVLPAGVELVATDAQADVRAPGSYLYEPDPAVIRAGAVADLAHSLDLWQIDTTIAYLSGDALIPTPFARSWRILEHHPFELKALNRRLRVLQGQVIAVKKRGSPVDPEAFRRRLYRHPQGRPLVVVLTRVAGKPWMLVCETTT